MSIVSIAHRLSEDIWFNRNQRMLVDMAKTSYGRDILGIDKNLPNVFKVGKNYVKYYDGQVKSEFRTYDEYAKNIVERNKEFEEYSRYFLNPYIENVSPMVRLAQSMVATTTVVNPNAAPESTSVDGYVTANSASSFSAARGKATGDAANDSGTTLRVAVGRNSSNIWEIDRMALYFDTSAISTDVVSAATLEIYPTTVNDLDNDAQGYISVVAATLASNTAVVAADFDQFGTTKLSDDIDLSTTATGAYKLWTLNAAGIAAVDGSGITKLGMREGHDIENANPTTTAGQFNRIICDAADGTNDPKLTVTHAAVTFTPRLIIF